MQNNSHSPWLAMLLAISCNAGAQQAAADQLSRIEAETLILKAREKQLIVQSSIVAKEAEIASKQSETSRLTRPGTSSDPTVQSVEGIGAALHATLQLENGSTIDVQAGDVLPNGMTVVSIRGNQVIVAENKRRIRLGASGNSGFGSAPLASTAAVRSPFSLPPVLPFSSQKGGLK